MGLLFILPFLLLAFFSLSRGWFFPDILPASLSLANAWKALSGSQGLVSSLLLSLSISIPVAALATFSGFIMGRIIVFHPRRKRILIMAYFPFVLAPVIYAVCLQFYFVWAGLSGEIPGVILAQLLITFPFSVILFAGYWNERLRSMEDLVATLGGSLWQAYFRVLIPLSKGMLAVAFFQTFLISWFEFGLTSIIGVGKVQTLTISVYQFVGEANISFAAMASCLLILPPVLLLWLNKRIVFTNIV
jgi:putative spermidine/putrescine transport system permease protein